MAEGKTDLRARIKRQRRSLAPNEVAERSGRVATALEEWPFYEEACTILFYASFQNEVDTFCLMSRALEAGKRVVLPRVQVVGKRLHLHRVKSLENNLESGPYGIKSPASGCPKVAPSDLDLMVLPGLAFDRQGFRLGFGGGYYDRLLESLNPEIITVGLAYEFQVVDEVPHEDHDQPVQYVATEGEVFRTQIAGS